MFLRGVAFRRKTNFRRGEKASPEEGFFMVYLPDRTRSSNSTFPRDRQSFDRPFLGAKPLS